MKEHLKGQIETDKPMTEEEMQFHYFKLHDYDNNSMLDGTELVKAFTHHQRGTGSVECNIACAFEAFVLCLGRSMNS